jgi:hypothetical protein
MRRKKGLDIIFFLTDIAEEELSALSFQFSVNEEALDHVL